MTGNFRFSDKHFPANGKPPPVFYTWKDKERRAAWWLESNRRKERGNGADPDTSSLADEIKAAERKHWRRTGNGAGEPPQDGQNPPYGVAEDTADGAESSKTGDDPDRAKHDSKSDKEAFLRLSKLSRAEYDRVRVKEAEALGIRIATLDKEVEALRPKSDTKAGQGRALNISDPEPWADAVDVAELLDTIEGLIKRFVVCDGDERAAIALWILCTHFEEAAQVAPILNVQSPEPRCGKTTFLSIVAKLAKRALPSSNISGPSIFRVIEDRAPTLIIDEADSFLADNEEARGIINSGHTRDTAFVIRIEGDARTPMMFSTWGFKAISGIGKRAATIEDRSIVINLKRKAKGEKIARLRHAPKADFADVASKLARVAKDQMATFSSARPDLPEALNDRAQDNWEHLFAIAAIAGGHWPDKAKQAALSLSGVENEEPSQNTALLEDIREAFGDKDEITGEALVSVLVAMHDRPWGECNHGRALTQNLLARKLKPFGIFTKRIGPKRDRARGYDLESFNDAFSRYTPFATVHPDTTNEVNDLDENQSVHHDSGWTVANQPDLLNLNGVSGWTDETPLNGEREGNGDAGEAQGLAAQGLAAAKRGHDWLSAFWAELTPEERKAVGGQDALMAWKIIAARV
jgi:Protein of unknown function (DUF3631)